MSDKRSACRVRRRLPVTFSDGRPHRGLTANLSRTGACIHADYVVTPGTELELTLGLPGISDVHLRGVVEWARKLRGSETLSAGHSMGLRYTTPPGPEYADFMALIEGLAQPHGLTTRQAEPGAAPAAAGRPRRQVEVVALHAPVVEIPHPRPAPAGRSRPEKNLDFVVSEHDLAASADYACSLSTARVAWLLEQGAAELIAPRLKGRMATVGLSLEVNVPPAPVAVGTALEVVVALVAMGNDRRSFVFELEIRSGERLVASGRHVRQAVEPAAH